MLQDTHWLYLSYDINEPSNPGISYYYLKLTFKEKMVLKMNKIFSQREVAL